VYVPVEIKKGESKLNKQIKLNFENNHGSPKKITELEKKLTTKQAKDKCIE